MAPKFGYGYLRVKITDIFTILAIMYFIKYVYKVPIRYSQLRLKSKLFIRFFFIVTCYILEGIWSPQMYSWMVQLSIDCNQWQYGETE